MKNKTQAEMMHLSKVASLPCCISGMRPVQIHHLRYGMGMGQRNDNFHVIPLHYDFHQGRLGIHTMGRKKWQEIYGDEIYLWRKTMTILYGEDESLWPHV